MKKTILSLLVIASLYSCKKDDDTAQPSPGLDSRKVLISCEGSFGSSNASITAYGPSTLESVQGIFESANGYPIGDVLQSMVRVGENVLSTVNNSSKVEVFDFGSGEVISTINDLGFPRFINAPSDEVAFVSDFNFGNGLEVIDLIDHTVVATIDTDGETTGEIVFSNGKGYICFESADFVRVIDINTHETIADVTVGKTPVSLEVDSDGNVWVLSTGLWYDAANGYAAVQEDASISRIDTQVDALEYTHDFDEDAGLFDMEISAAGETIFFVHDEVMHSLDTETGEVSSLSEFALSGPFYGKMGLDPVSGEVYLAQYGDFESMGTVFRYSSTGSLLDQIETGIAPNGFLFSD